MNSAVVAIALIGFGEVGHRFARDFSARGGIALTASDVAMNDPARRPTVSARAEALGVRPARDIASACETARVVISAVTADQSKAVARDAGALLRAGQIYLDVNSASPGAKAQSAEYVTRSGASYVEGAVMGPVKGAGIGVEILAGGPAAAEAAALLNGLGMNLTAVSETFGRASAMKLSRSIMIKGIEALIGDCAAAAKHWGVEDEVYASLAKTFPSTDWRKAATYMAERVAIHGKRRASEMREAGEMLADIGRDPSLACAVADSQLRGVARTPK